MSLVIRIPLPVTQLHALAGYFTDGPSMMALYGFVSELERRVNVEFDGLAFSRFGLVVDSYESRLGELLVTGFDSVPRIKQQQARATTSYRCADMDAALYLETESLSADDRAFLLETLEAAVNCCRIQGGHLAKYISANPEERYALQAEDVSTAADLLAFMVKHERLVHEAYLSRHLPKALMGDQLIDAYASALVSKMNLLVCNGYRAVGTAQDSQGNAQRIAEPMFTLAERMPLHVLTKVSPDCLEMAFKDFFWAFDTEQHNTNPNHFSLV